MTGFLNLDLLRTHEASWDCCRDLARVNNPRPRLVAAWHVDADGRLACRWQTDDESEFVSSG